MPYLLLLLQTARPLLQTPSPTQHQQHCSTCRMHWLMPYRDSRAQTSSQAAAVQATATQQQQQQQTRLLCWQ
jgi:hypothetical protein